MDRAQLLKVLQDIVGAENVVFHPDDLLVYEYDGSVDRGIPSVVVLPGSTDEVCRVMAIHSKRASRWPAGGLAPV